MQDAPRQREVLPHPIEAPVAGEAEFERGNERLMARLDAKAATGVAPDEAVYPLNGFPGRGAVQVQRKAPHDAASAKAPRM